MLPLRKKLLIFEYDMTSGIIYAAKLLDYVRKFNGIGNYLL